MTDIASLFANLALAQLLPALQVWFTADNYWATLFAVNRNIKAQFDANGIEMTYPHLNVHLDK